MEAASCRSDHRTRGLLGRTASILSIISQKDRSSRPSEDEAHRFRAAAAEPLRAAGPGGLWPAAPGADGRSSRPGPAKAGAGRKGLAHGGISSWSRALPPHPPGRPSRTLQARSGYMHLLCWDHPGSKRLLRCSLTGVAGTEIKSVGILRGMLLE